LASARWFEDADRPAALAALARHRAALIAAGREGCTHLKAAAAPMLDELLDACAVVLVGDYLVAFQINRCWLTRAARVLDEVIVLRVTRHHGNRLRNVVQEMERIARVNGCIGLHVGTFGDASGRLAALYRRLGFKPAPPQLYKEF